MESCNFSGLEIEQLIQETRLRTIEDIWLVATGPTAFFIVAVVVVSIFVVALCVFMFLRQLQPKSRPASLRKKW